METSHETGAWHENYRLPMNSIRHI